MKKILYISTLLLILTLNKLSIAQVVPWTVVPTSQSQTIVLNKVDSTVSYDFSLNTIGDALGIFYDKSGVWTCAGYLQFDGVTKSFLVYGNDAVDNGFQPFESYHFMYWRKSKNCVIDNPFGAMINAQYTTGGSDTIITVVAKPAVVQYPSDYYCKFNNGVVPVPLQITNTTFSNLSINITPAGLLGYDPGTGNLEDLNICVPGVYTLHMTTLDNRCMRNDTFALTIGTNLKSNPTISTTQPTCLSPLGTITLDTSTIGKGVKPYTYSLQNTATTISKPSANGLFTNLNVAPYKLIIQDQKSCADTFSINIVPNPINCDDIGDILTPNNNGPHSEVVLPWSGQTKIYNSFGQLINSFTTPATWDGKDQYGNVVKTGAYFIFTNGEKKKEITVVD